VLRINDTEADDQQLDELTKRLRDELVALNLAVDPVAAGEAPPGAKSVEIAAVGALMLTLSQSSVLAAIISAVSNWLGQRRQRTVRLELDGDALKLTGHPSDDQRRAIDTWLRRHEPGREVGPSVAEVIDGRHALIVANYDYQDPGLRQLRAPAHDAEQLARVPRDPAIGAFTVRTAGTKGSPWPHVWRYDNSSTMTVARSPPPPRRRSARPRQGMQPRLTTRRRRPDPPGRAPTPRHHRNDRNAVCGGTT
jgi:hypothetical protein